MFRRRSNSLGSQLNHLSDNPYESQVQVCLKWEWFDPPEDSAPVHFFLKTSLHGLQYLGERKRHMCERVFWLTAFLAAVLTATLLIWQMWAAYVDMPIVTVFSPTETTLDRIPFPAVTICSVNNVKKSKFEEYRRDAMRGLKGELSNETTLKRFANILDIYHVCNSAQSFTERFYDPGRPKDVLSQTMYERRLEYRQFLNAPATIRDASHSCSEMILFCLWLDSVKNCSDLFEQIDTDYGYCCTFNMIPLSLLRKFAPNTTEDPQRVNEWREADLNYENIIVDKKTNNRTYPYRQLYAGRSAGLSILVDPDMEQYHCTNTDSEGFIVGINVPLDFPRMKDSGIAIKTSTEAFISVHPEITLSDQSARSSTMDKRHCYFEGEKMLNYYNKYTSSNCLDECIAQKTFEVCGCLRYYMPRSRNFSTDLFCKPTKYNCTGIVRENMIKSGLDNECNNCWPACTEITYHTEVSSLSIREQKIQKLFEHHPNLDELTNGNRANNVSIIHIFFNVDSVFPRLRKEMSTTIDLISNAGGLLGLCMGFSMLSLLEIIYHLSIRMFCNAYRERCKDPSGNMHNRGFIARVLNLGSFQRLKENSDSDSVVVLEEEPYFKIKRQMHGDKNILPVYFRTPFETDFQRAYVASSWLSQQPNFVSDRNNQ